MLNSLDTKFSSVIISRAEENMCISRGRHVVVFLFVKAYVHESSLFFQYMS
jgi:hypothetical protein